MENNNLWIISLAVVGIVAIIAIFGMVNMTGMAEASDFFGKTGTTSVMPGESDNSRPEWECFKDGLSVKAYTEQQKETLENQGFYCEPIYYIQ